MNPQQWQLDQDEQEKAQQLGTRNMSTLGEVVREVIELRPNGRYHQLQTLPALKRLCAKPNTCNHASDEHGKIRAANSKRSSCKDWEVDAEYTPGVAI